jgi:hypothetical protein
MLVEYSSGGSVLQRYVHGSGADEPLVWYEGSGATTKRHLHAAFIPYKDSHYRRPASTGRSS